MKSVIVFLVMVCCSSVPGFSAELPGAAVVKAAKEAFQRTLPAKPVLSGTLVQPFGPYWDKSGVYVLFPGQKWRNSENGKPSQAVAIAPGVVQRGTAKAVFFQLFFRADASGQWEFVDPAGFGIR